MLYWHELLSFLRHAGGKQVILPPTNWGPRVGGWHETLACSVVNANGGLLRGATAGRPACNHSRPPSSIHHAGWTDVRLHVRQFWWWSPYVHQHQRRELVQSVCVRSPAAAGRRDYLRNRHLYRVLRSAGTVWLFRNHQVYRCSGDY